MDNFVDNYFSINVTDYNMNLPLHNALYTINILSPIIIFSLNSLLNSLEEPSSNIYVLNIHDILNNIDISLSEYEYYMQFIFYPKFIYYLNQSKKEKDYQCKTIFRSFYPRIEDHCGNDCEIDYEKAKPYLIRYFNISTDPREILSIIKDDGRWPADRAMEITKEPWYIFLMRKCKYCIIQEGQDLGFNDNYYKKLESIIYTLSTNLPFESIKAYLIGVNKYNLKI
jgi:hypothetical protein